MTQKLGGPTDLEPGTIVRLEWMDGSKKLVIWGVVAEDNMQGDIDLLFHAILGEPAGRVGHKWWALKHEDSWRVGKRPPAKFWVELAKWRLLGDQQD
jgi:hypothetical protein